MTSKTNSNLDQLLNSYDSFIAGINEDNKEQFKILCNRLNTDGNTILELNKKLASMEDSFTKQQNFIKNQKLALEA